MTITDLLIIGGGINGTGIAADAAGRGLTVTLCESHDLASGTSSASTQLIHGGLRYLEQCEFKLVRKALIEREVLLAKAPHIISPLEFILPHDKHVRPAWMLRLGLFLYDHLVHRGSLPKSRSLDLTHSFEGIPLKARFKRGFSYADCRVDDARLVVLNAIAARENGANILTNTECLKAVREHDIWRVTVKNNETGHHYDLLTKALINAAGPWVGHVFDHVIEARAKQNVENVKLVKGSHIVVPKLYEGEHAYILQNLDARMVFAIPYHEEFTLIGTTEVDYDGDPRNVMISTEEKRYLCDIINHSFKTSLSLNDIVWDYAGVRPLYDDHTDDASKITRDYHLELDDDNGAAPLLTIFGGKITSYRKLAEQAITKLQRYFSDLSAEWTANKPLPGGDISDSIDDYVQTMLTRHPFLPEKLLKRYVHTYGTLMQFIVKDASSLADLGQHLAAGLYQAELEYLVNREWACCADDILWRRTKLGLHVDLKTAVMLGEWVKNYRRQQLHAKQS